MIHEQLRQEFEQEKLEKPFENVDIININYVNWLENKIQELQAQLLLQTIKD